MRTRCRLEGAAVFLLLLAFAPSAGAQTGNEGSIEGTVVDPSGAVIPGVILRARNLGTSATFTTTSSPEGLFRFPVLPVGSYELEAQQKGFATVVLKEVVVSVGVRLSLTVSLVAATQEETIVVSGETMVFHQADRDWVHNLLFFLGHQGRLLWMSG